MDRGWGGGCPAGTALRSGSRRLFFPLLSLGSSKDPPGIVVFREEGLGHYRWCISQS